MRVGVLAFAFALAVLVGCGPDEIVEAELDEICGEPGPFRVLELDDEELFAGTIGLGAVGDRLYFTVGDAVTEADAPFDENPFGADTPKPARPHVVSTGHCGEDPRAIAEGVRVVYEDARWPGALLGRAEESNDVLVLDPLGIESPRVLVPELPGMEYAPGRRTSADWTEYGLVNVVPEPPDATIGALMLEPFPATVDDPPPATVALLEDVSASAGFAVRDDAVFALTGDAIVRLDLVDGGVETVLEGVVDFIVSTDARFVAYRTPAPSGDPDAALPTFVLDRDDGSTTWIADSSHWNTNSFDTRLVIQLDSDPALGSRVVEFPSLQTFDVPPGLYLLFPGPDGRYLATSTKGYVLYDLDTGDVQLLYAGTDPVSFGEDALYFLGIGWNDGPDYFRRTGSLWRAPYDGGDPERLARRATASRFLLPDERVLTLVEVDDAYLGTLIVVEPGSLEEHHIDERVSAGSIAELPEAALGTGVIAYGVRDGDRSGVWLAKPAPP